MDAINHRHYFPILKGKRGEYSALASLSIQVRSKLTPIIEVPLISQFSKNSDVAQHAAKQAEYINTFWSRGRSLFVDMRLIDLAAPIQAWGGMVLNELTLLLAGRPKPIIPVIGMRRSLAYLNAAQAVHEETGSGYMLRLEDADFADDDPELLRQFLQKMGVTNDTDVHLMVDLGYVDEQARNSKRMAAMGMLLSVLDTAQWASFSLAASAYPPQIPISTGETKLIPRTDWSIWESLAHHKSLRFRIPSFSDYSITSRDMSDADPRLMKTVPKLTYTTESDWYCAKKSRDEDGGYSPFREICAELVRTDYFKGKDFSTADAYFQKCADRQAGPGSPEIWIKYGTVHHLTMVVDQLSKQF